MVLCVCVVLFSFCFWLHRKRFKHEGKPFRCPHGYLQSTAAFFFSFLCFHLGLSHNLRKNKILTARALTVVWKNTLIDFVFAARYYQRFKKPFCQHRRELSGNSITVCVGCFRFKGFFFSFVWAHFFPPPFSLLYFSYSVTSKPSFFKPLPSSSVYFPYFGWKVYGSKAVILAASAAALPALRSHVSWPLCLRTWCWLTVSCPVDSASLPRHLMDSLSRALCNSHSATYTA